MCAPMGSGKPEGIIVALVMISELFKGILESFKKVFLFSSPSRLFSFFFFLVLWKY